MTADAEPPPGVMPEAGPDGDGARIRGGRLKQDRSHAYFVRVLTPHPAFFKLRVNVSFLNGPAAPGAELT